MTLALWVAFGVMLALSTVVIGYSVHKRNRIPCMTGMMIAMTLGMMVGLMAGVIFGVLYSGNLFLSTLLSMSIGIGAGFLAGLPVSVMAVLDGMLSGLMGGMMGAMLGEMVPIEYQNSLIQIMFVLFIGIILILLYMMQQEFTRKEDSKSSLFQHPLFMTGVLAAFFFGYNQLGSAVHITQGGGGDIAHPQHGSVEKGIGNQSHPLVKTKENNRSDEGRQIIVRAAEFSYAPAQINLRVGEKVTLVLDNEGKVEHDLEIVQLKANIGGQDLSHGAKQNDVHIHAGPGEVQAITFTPLQSGEYKVFCTIPGHEEAGMVGVVNVS